MINNIVNLQRVYSGNDARLYQIIAVDWRYLSGEFGVRYLEEERIFDS